MRRGGVGSVGESERIPERQKRKRTFPLFRSRKILPKNLTATQKYAIIYGGREGHCPCGRSALAAAGKDS